MGLAGGGTNISVNNTWVRLAAITLNGTQAAWDFTNIDTSYTAYKVIYFGLAGNTGATPLSLTINGITTNTYTYEKLQGAGAAASAATAANQASMYAGIEGNGLWYMLEVLLAPQAGQSKVYINLVGGLYGQYSYVISGYQSGQTNISRITITAAANWTAGSTAILLGLKNA